MKLYEIANHYMSLMDNDITIEQTALDSIQESLEEKAVSIGKVIKSLEAEEEAIEKACKDMHERSQKIASKIDYLRDYLKNNLIKCQIDIVKSPFFDIKIKKNPGYVFIHDEKSIPSEYFKEKRTLQLDRSTIANELKNGVIIEGVSLKKDFRLEIR